jgi:hypothetical protein
MSQDRRTEEIMAKKRKLTTAEAERLVQFVDDHEGQVATGLLLRVSPYTLSRTANRRTAPSPMLWDKLIEHGIVTA